MALEGDQAGICTQWWTPEPVILIVYLNCERKTRLKMNQNPIFWFFPSLTIYPVIFGPIIHIWYFLESDTIWKLLENTVPAIFFLILGIFFKQKFITWSLMTLAFMDIVHWNFPGEYGLVAFLSQRSSSSGSNWFLRLPRWVSLRQIICLTNETQNALLGVMGLIR